MSMLLGHVVTRLFKLPSWATPAISFNNTTALPLLLIESLSSTGILDQLLASETDTTAAALARAKSYFLVNAIVGDSLTFALGPKLLDGEEEAPPKKERDEDEQDGQATKQDDHPAASTLFPRNTLENYQHTNGRAPENQDQEPQQVEHPAPTDDPNERTSLLPGPITRTRHAAAHSISTHATHLWSHLPSFLRHTLSFTSAFLHAPLLGALTGALIGLLPPLHKVFFASPQHGGIFTAWLTDSVSQIGNLFAALQVVVVGVKLSSSMRKMKRGEESGEVPWVPLIFVTVMRFFVWPVVSVGVVYAVVRKGWVERDPVLWFVMMLMPTGPPAMKLTALADVSGSGEGEKMGIAKFLCVSGFLFYFSGRRLLASVVRWRMADYTAGIDHVCDQSSDLLHRRRELESLQGCSGGHIAALGSIRISMKPSLPSWTAK